MSKLNGTKANLVPIIFLVCILLGLSACSTNSPPKSASTLNTQQKVELATVMSVKNVTIQHAHSDTGNNIGVTIGSGGRSGIYGSIDLGTLSRILNHTNNTQEAQEIIIRKSNGEFISITQVSKEVFKKGESVKIIIRNGKSHVIH